MPDIVPKLWFVDSIIFTRFHYPPTPTTLFNHFIGKHQHILLFIPGTQFNRDVHVPQHDLQAAYLHVGNTRQPTRTHGLAGAAGLAGLPARGGTGAQLLR